MSDYPLEPMADVVTARLRAKPLANVQRTYEPEVPLAVEPTNDVEPGVVVEPMADIVTARLRFSPRLSKVGSP